MRRQTHASALLPPAPQGNHLEQTLRAPRRDLAPRIPSAHKHGTSKASTGVRCSNSARAQPQNEHLNQVSSPAPPHQRPDLPATTPENIARWPNTARTHGILGHLASPTPSPPRLPPPLPSSVPSSLRAFFNQNM